VLEFTVALARRTGERLREVLGRLPRGQVAFKGCRDMVTAADREAQRFIAAQIEARFPADAIVAEESLRRGGSSGRVWIVDPLDGTTNFVHGHPMFCVSLALAEGFTDGPVPEESACDGQTSGYFPAGKLPRLRAAAICAPILGETYWAERGGGSWLNGSRLTASGEGDLGRMLVATGFAYRRNELKNSNLENFSRVALEVQGIRRGGSAALDLCYVAAGRFDAFWELYLKPWDVAAGMLLVREAGGEVTDLAGRDRGLEGVAVLAGGEKARAALEPILEGPDPAWAAQERRRLRA
jgi:myo-inositol-1(or 4)-monophosphatase